MKIFSEYDYIDENSSDKKRGEKEFDALAALRLPDLHGKCYLDIEGGGLFCGFALHEQASRVHGVLGSHKQLTLASNCFQNAHFYSSLTALAQHQPDVSYDVITLSATLDSPGFEVETLIPELMGKLSPQGVLVMDITLSDAPGDQWVNHQHGQMTFQLPTRKKLSVLLNGYAWKVISNIKSAEHDTIRRRIIHVKKMLPYVYLLVDTPGSGKSTLMRALFKRAKVSRVSGDRTYYRILHDKYNVSDALMGCVKDHYAAEKIAHLTEAIFENTLYEEMVDLWSSVTRGKSFVLDSYIPVAYRDKIIQCFSERGYYPVLISFPEAELMMPASLSTRRVGSFERFVNQNKSTEGYGVMERFTSFMKKISRKVMLVVSSRGRL
jgi:predicted kinase